MLVCAASLAVGCARGQPAPSSDASVGSGTVCVFTTSYVTQDLFRGYFLGGRSVEPSLDLSNGIYDLGFWSNSTVSNRVQGPSSTEVEIYGSYTETVLKDRLSLEPGFTLYALPWGPGFYGAYHRSIEPSIGFNLTAGGLQISPKVYDDLVLKMLTWEFNATYTIPLKPVRTELDLTATLGAEESSFQAPGAPASPKTWSSYWLIQVAAPFQIGRRATWTVGWCYTGSSIDQSGPFALGGHPVSSRGLLTTSLALRL